MAEQQTVNTTDQRSLSWEKPLQPAAGRVKAGGRWRFLVGGTLIIGAILYLIINSTLLGAQYFITVEDLLSDSAYVGKTVRISGAVIGDTIEYQTMVGDGQQNAVTFTVSHIPQEFDSLLVALNQSVNNPNAARLQIYYEGPVPDLLQHEAQAIMTGELGTDGVFHASELLLKCPSRFENGGSTETLGNEHPEF